MTVLQMHTALRLYLDKSNSLAGAVDFLPEEFDFWLNEAQLRFIKQRMQNFEGSPKRVEDLNVLICHTSKLTLTANTKVGSNVKEVALPISDATKPYLFYVNSSVYNSAGASLQTGDTLTHENISLYIKDAINNPWIKRPLTIFWGDESTGVIPTMGIIYGDEFVPTQADITYIRRPKTLVNTTTSGYYTTTCELPVQTHNEIVAIAAGLLLENIESPRTQTYPQLNESKIE